MENGAEEPEQSETLAEIRNSTDSEEANTTTSLQGKEVHHAVEDVLNEHSLHSNGRDLTLADEDTLGIVSGNDFSASTLDNKGDFGAARIFEDHSASTADGIENASTVSSERSMDGAKEGKEPENENSEFIGDIGPGTDRNEDLSTSKEELSIASDTNEDSPTVHGEVSEENLELNELPSLSDTAQEFSATEDGDVELLATNELHARDVIPSAENDNGIEPAQADEEKTKDEGVALETPSTADSAASVAAEDNPFDSLLASEESRKEDTQTDELDVTPATVEERGVEDKNLEPEEALAKETEVDEAHSNHESPESVTVEEDEGHSRTENDEAGKGTEPALADEEQAKDEGLALEMPLTTDSAAAVAAEEDNPFDSLSTTEESRKDPQRDEVDVIPATEEERGVEDKDLEPEAALPNESEVDEALSNQEAPESVTIVEDEAPSSTETDEVDFGVETTEPESATTVAELLKDESFTDEVPPSTISTEAPSQADSVPLYHQVFTDASGLDEPPSTGESAKATTVEDEKDVAGIATEEHMEDNGLAEISPGSFNALERDEDLAPAEPSEGKEPVELGSTAESTVATPVEEAENDGDLNSAAPIEDQNPDALASTPESTEVTPESTDESVLDEPPFNRESADATTVEDKKDVTGELDLSPDFTNADLVEDPENVDHEEHLQFAAPPGDKEPDELDSTVESTEEAINDEDLDSAVPIEDQHPDELASTPESTVVTPVCDASSVYHNDVEPVTPKDDTKADGLVPASDLTEHSPTEDIKNAEPVQDLVKEDFIAEEKPGGGQFAETSRAMEETSAEVPTSHEELSKETETEKVASTSDLVEGLHVEHEKASDELSPAGNSGEVILDDDTYDGERVNALDRLDKVEFLGDEIPSMEKLPEAIPAVEDEVVDASTSHDQVDNGETTDEVAQFPDSDRASLVEGGTDAEPLTGDEVVTEEDNSPDEISLISDSSDATIVEDEDEDLESSKDSEALTSQEELPKEVAMTAEFSRGLEASNTTSFEDSEADGVFEADKSVEDPESTPTLEDVEASTSQELGKEETETSPAIADKGTEVLTSHEELAKETETETEEGAPTSELVGGNPVEDEKDIGAEELNEDDLVPGSVAANLVIEDKNVEFLTPSEEVPKEETAEDHLAPVPQSPEFNADDRATDVEHSTADGLSKDEGSYEKVLTDSTEEICEVETEGGESSILHEEHVEASASQELGKEEIVDEAAAQSPETSNVTPLEGATGGEVVTDGKYEHLAEEIHMNAADAIPAAEDQNVEAVTSDEELAIEGNTDEVAEHSESGDATLVDDLKDVGSVITDGELKKEDRVESETLLDADSANAVPVVEDNNLESPATHEELAKEDHAVLDDSALTSESGWATSGVADEAVEASISHEDLAQEETKDEIASAPGSGEATVVEDAVDGEPVIGDKEVDSKEDGAGEAASIEDSEDATSAPEKKESDDLHDSELAKEADSPEELQRTSPLTQFDDQNNDTFKDAVQVVVKEEGPTDETIDQTFSSANDDKVEEREILLEKTPKPVLTRESVASDGDDTLDRIVESADPALTADLGGATQSHKAQIVNNFHSLHSAVLTTSSSKVIQTRDLDPDLLQELPEKTQNVAQDSEEDMTAVPLSTQPTDLSSSWVSVSPIEELQSASVGFQRRLSQKSQSRRPDDELTYDGDDWRIVSEQDVSALSVSKDVDTGSSGTKFPFSLVLWCSQSLFGGHKKIRND